jgi:flagellar L-ring protein precursor FlgH
MIHHCEVVNTPRRVTVIPAVPPARPRARNWGPLAALAAALLLMASAARAMGAQPAPAARPDSAKAPARAINWTSDRRTFGVGDVLQVWVDEYALAEANKSTANTSSRRRRMDIGVAPPALPGAAAPMGAVDASIETGDGGDSRQRGTASRDTRYVGELAVRVIAVTPEGLLQVKGTKTIDVDKNKTTLTISGLVRPIDVGARDIVRSEAIADAQISYAAPKGLGKPKNGIISKILGLFWP